MLLTKPFHIQYLLFEIIIISSPQTLDNCIGDEAMTASSWNQIPSFQIPFFSALAWWHKQRLQTQMSESKRNPELRWFICQAFFTRNWSITNPCYGRCLPVTGQQLHCSALSWGPGTPCSKNTQITRNWRELQDRRSVLTLASSSLEQWTSTLATHWLFTVISHNHNSGHG